MPDTACPCGSGDAFEVCCQPVIQGQKNAESAEMLMRSRYSAFATGDTAYLLTSWHSSTRPPELSLDDRQQWIRLKIVDAGYDIVEFIATCKLAGRAHRLHERSRFVCEAGRWFYLAGELPDE